MNHAVFAAGRRIVPALVLSLLACTDVDGPRTVRRPAVIASGTAPAYFTMPTSARVGEPITVVVISYSGGCARAGETDVVVSGAVAEVRPYRYVVVDPNAICAMNLRSDSNVAVFTFSIPGSDTVRVIGVRDPGEAPYSVERAVTVSP